MKRLLTICTAALLIAGCSKSNKDQADDSSKPETLTKEFNEAEMDAAMKTARSRVDEFLNASGSVPNDTDLSEVSVIISDLRGVRRNRETSL